MDDLDETAQRMLVKLYRGGGLSFRERISPTAKCLRAAGLFTVANDGPLLTSRGVTTARELAEAVHG